MFDKCIVLKKFVTGYASAEWNWTWRVEKTPQSWNEKQLAKNLVSLEEK